MGVYIGSPDFGKLPNEPQQTKKELRWKVRIRSINFPIEVPWES